MEIEYIVYKRENELPVSIILLAMALLSVLVVLQVVGLGFGMEIPERRERLNERYIIGGRNASITEFPYTVSIHNLENYICGGAIVSEVFILTAAHCLKNSANGTRLTVRVGSHFREKEGVVHKVKRIAQHPKFGRYDYDVGVIELSEPIKFGKEAAAIPVRDELPKPGEMGTVTGYGYYNEDEDLPTVLQTVDIPVISDEDCRRSILKVTPRVFCTYEMGKSPYFGDSGSPIVIDGKLAGSVSSGTNRPKEYPSGYAKFSDVEMREFIKKETGI